MEKMRSFLGWLVSPIVSFHVSVYFLSRAKRLKKYYLFSVERLIKTNQGREKKELGGYQSKGGKTTAEKNYKVFGLNLYI